MTISWITQRFGSTLRSKILLAFAIMVAIIGAFAQFAVGRIEASGRLLAETYDRPLTAVNAASRAQAGFLSLELAIEQNTASPESIERFQYSIEQNLTMAQQQAARVTTASAGRTAAQAFAAWRSTREAAPTVGSVAAHGEQTDRVIGSLRVLGELTTEDVSLDRQHVLGQIRHDRAMLLLATMLVLLSGGLTATILARKVLTPIAAASLAATRIAAGDLNTVIQSRSKDELGELLAAMLLMRDNLREAMDREVAARRSAQTQLADAIEGARSGLALVGPDGRVLIANSRIRQFFPTHRNAFARGDQVPPEIGEGLAHPTGELQLEDGRWLRITHTPSKEGGMVLTASEISFLKQREAALREARDEAEAANRAKTDFLANMSHELRTPLSAVIGFSEMIVNETCGPVGQPQYREFAGDILHSGRHLMDVITDILDIAKAHSGTIELRKRTVRPEELMRAAVRVVHDRARDANLTLTSHIEEQLPAIDADTTRLRQVLLNLLTNAIKFTAPGGAVVAQVCRHADGIAMRIQDTGAGMASRDIPRALQPFVQVDTSLARLHSGTGLGLPLAKIFVELHGGRLEIESSVNVGTTVTVILPASTKPAFRVADMLPGLPVAASGTLLTRRPNRMLEVALPATPLLEGPSQCGSRATAEA